MKIGLNQACIGSSVQDIYLDRKVHQWTSGLPLDGVPVNPRREHLVISLLEESLSQT